MPDEFTRLEDQLFPGLKNPKRPSAEDAASGGASPDAEPAPEESKRRRVRIRQGGASAPAPAPAPAPADEQLADGFLGALDQTLNDLGGRTGRVDKAAISGAHRTVLGPSDAPATPGMFQVPPAVEATPPLPAPVAASEAVPMAWWQVDVDTAAGPRSFVVDGADLPAAVQRARQQLGTHVADGFELRNVRRVDLLDSAPPA